MGFRSYSEHKIPLWDLFFEFSASQCLDARDKIYGLAALAAEMVDLEIDYSKSVTQKYVDVIGLRSYHSEAASLIVDFSQRLQTHLDQQVTTPDPPSIVTLISVVGSVGFGKGAITRFEPLEYRSVEDRRYAEGAKESVEAIVIPIFSGVSCGVQGGTLHGMCPSDGPHQRASKPWREVDDSLWTKLSMPIKQPNHDSSNTPPRLFISDKGGLGIAPGNAQVTDRIIGFWSSNVFAVIRWMGDRYIIVGRAVLLPFPDGWDPTRSLDKENMDILDPASYTTPYREPLHFKQDPCISLALDLRTLQLLTRCGPAGNESSQLSFPYIKAILGK